MNIQQIAVFFISGLTLFFASIFIEKYFMKRNVKYASLLTIIFNAFISFFILLPQAFDLYRFAFTKEWIALGNYTPVFIIFVFLVLPVSIQLRIYIYNVNSKCKF